jgi:hypothetical protein
MLCVFLGATQARADSATISVTNTAGQSDPVAGVPRVFTVSGVAAVPEDVFVKYRSTGGAPCAPDASEDSGTAFYSGLGYPGLAYGDEVNGSFQLAHVFTWGSPGTDMFCIWLAKDANTIASPITETITFRAPTGTITASVNPVTPMPGQQFTITITGASESPDEVFATVRAAGGAGCAPTFQADSGQGLVNGQNVNGSFSVQANTTETSAGAYLLCLWLADSSSAIPAIAGPQPETFTVVSPPPIVSSFCLRDRAGVGHDQRVVRFYLSKVHAHHISRRAKRGYERALIGARRALAKFLHLRRLNCPNGR